MGSAEERVARLEAQIERLLETVSALQAENARLRARVAELESKLGMNSTNSHKPPSSDPPGARPGKSGSGRSRGGQKGHKGHRRERLTPSKVTEVDAKQCACCGSKNLSRTADEPRWHQNADLPQSIQVDVHEWRRFASECADCSSVTWAPLPDSVPLQLIGPRLGAFIAVLLASRMSRRDIQTLLADVFGFPVALGTLSGEEQRISERLAPAADEAADYARAQDVKNVDASTWKQAGKLMSLWTIATSLVSVFFVRPDGTAPTVQALLGSLRGILVTDRGSQFGFWAMAQRQICWAHLLRKFVSFSERDGPAGALGRDLVLCTQVLFVEWHAFRDGKQSRAQMATRLRVLETAIIAHLHQGVRLGIRGVSGSCKDVLQHSDALFTFVHVEGVEPTNNHAERMLRALVIWRKTSYGSQSERGSLFTARLMTAAQTLRQQGRSLYEFMVDIALAGTRGRKYPSLLPVNP